MEYLSVREIAGIWGVSVRNVQRLLAEGRVPGAKKIGVSWAIPAAAEKPGDPRRQKRRTASRRPYVDYTILPKEDPDCGIARLPERYRAISAADLAYRRGDPQPAMDYWNAMDEDGETRLSAATLATAAAICAGNYALYNGICRDLDRRMARTGDAREKALLSLPETMAAVSMAAPDLTPKWLKDGDFSLFSRELYPFLLYLHAMHLRNTGDHASLLATGRTAMLLCAQEDTFTWLDVYFPLLCASACYGLGETEETDHYLSQAVDLGLRYGFLMPFVDYLTKFGGRMETMIDRSYPHYRAPLLALWNRCYKNWISFHNLFARDNLTTILTVQEYHVAHLLAAGLTYAETSRQMNLSKGRVNNLVSDIFGKLCINKRSQLGRFVV